MQQAIPLALESVIERLHDAVYCNESTHPCVDAVQRSLRACLQSTGWLPESCCRQAEDYYARHLVHRDPEGRFSVIAMVWGPHQGTPIHDHGGLWCVEGVYQGRLEITRYDLLGEVEDGIAHFRRHDQIQEGIGGTGALIPPVDYHTIENSTDQVAITVHVYGGDMTSCRAFMPRDDGAYEACQKALCFTSSLMI